MRNATLLLAAVALAGCYKVEYSATLQEPARIEQLTFAPGGSGTSTSYDLTGKGGISVGSVSIPDRYAVVISCPHGKFTLRPESENARRIFAKFKEGDSITVTYREEYHVTDTGRELAKLDFLDASPR